MFGFTPAVPSVNTGPTAAAEVGTEHVCGTSMHLQPRANANIQPEEPDDRNTQTPSNSIGLI